MKILLRVAQPSDIPFMQKMLYEAVFWRANPNKPSYEEALVLPEISNALADWAERKGDTGVVATIDSMPVGAAWFRYWTDDNFINGYIDKNMPVVVIAVHANYRHQGIGGKMIEWLIASAKKQSIEKISLSVSKDNYALNLYRQQGFVEHTDTGDMFLMIRTI